MWLWVISSSLLVIFLTQLFIVYLLLKRDKRMEAEKLVERHNKLNKPLIEQEEDKDEMRRTVELQLLRIRNAVQKQAEGIHQKEMELAPKETIIPEETLEVIYSEEKFNTIMTFMDTFNNYLNRFWYTKNGHLKTVFPGTPDNKESEAGRLIQRSHELCHEMDILLSSLFNRS
ncbi:hypothetical protein HXA31_05775 [Salipaludibacillus agaradhaerens]|uniref:Uncharacterized protein n=1 Tax=Salipaludibacillus agaradhaerens TaxID=76935 RepID=A0A9Q4B1E6_SALAG|nr:hypothetical protein [Salipaludibacillus agaradhaerens]MCR6096576.1 hypothetical protein [Salipaludibacillus agaradhaerens]MCR6113865.1 hypothetical protein [Salipaludibacillus agaradhaerens]